MEIRKVLFPVDLAGSSYSIASRVGSIADQFDAELHLVYVVEALDGYSTFFVPHRSLDLMETEGAALAKRHLEEFAEKHFEDRPRVKLAVLHGNPVEQIRKYIESDKIDMVIVATHDRPTLERAIFGNIAEQIARSSPVPVTVINPSIGEKAQMRLTARLHNWGRQFDLLDTSSNREKGIARFFMLPQSVSGERD